MPVMRRLVLGAVAALCILGLAQWSSAGADGAPACEAGGATNGFVQTSFTARPGDPVNQEYRRVQPPEWAMRNTTWRIYLVSPPGTSAYAGQANVTLPVEGPKELPPGTETTFVVRLTVPQLAAGTYRMGVSVRGASSLCDGPWSDSAWLDDGGTAVLRVTSDANVSTPFPASGLVITALLVLALPRKMH
jgi:hypothetical protein